MSLLSQKIFFIALFFYIFIGFFILTAQQENSVLPEDVESASLNDLIRMASQAQIDMTGNLEDLKSRLYQHYELDIPKKSKRITSHAKEVFSGKITDLNEPVIEFKGNVKVEIIEDGVVHSIVADTVKIYQNMKTIYAGDTIEYEYDKQKFYARNMIFNSENWSMLSISIRGGYIIPKSSHKQLKNLKKIHFSGEKIHKTSSGFIILDNAIATSCDLKEDPHYRIRFSNFWFNEEKNEFSAKNLALYAGYVPIFYLPIYYHSQDILFFNPVIGYRNLNGIFYHTTTYLYGQKTTNSEPTNTSLKVMLDYYSKLGVFGGIEGYIPYTKTKATLAVAHSHTIFDGTSLYPSSGPLEKQVNTSTWFGKTYPFRFGADIKGEIANINFNLQNYSDPYFNSDFLQRHENPLIFGLLVSLETEKLSKTKIYQTKSYVNYKQSWKFPKLGIESLAVDYLNFEYISEVKKNKNILSLDSPNYYFYTPSTINFPNLQISFNSSWILWKSQNDKDGTKKKENEENKEGDGEKDLLKDKNLKINQLENLKILDNSTTKRIFRPKALHGWKVNNNLSYVPQTSIWEDPKDVKLLFNNINNFTSSRISGGFEFSSNDRYLVIRDALELNLQYLERLNQAETNLSKIKTLETKDQNNRFFILNNIIDLNFYPFLDYKNWDKTGVDYNINSRIYQNIYDKILAGRKEYATFLPNDHSVNAQIRYDNGFVWEYVETKTDLPIWKEPKDVKVLFNSINNFTSTEVKFKSKTKSGVGFSYWGFRFDNYLFYSKNVSTFDSQGYGLEAKYQPLSKIAVSHASEVNFSGVPSLASVGLEVYGLHMNLIWKDSYLFDFQRPAMIWKNITLLNKEKQHAFTISNFSVTLKEDITVFKFLNDIGKIDLQVDGNWNIDLIRYNNSQLNFKFGLAVEIKKLVTLTISTNATNRATHIYFPFMRKTLGIAKSYNFFIDLWDSFKIWDLEARKKANFKLKNIEIKAVFDLHDWDLSISYIGGPKVGAFDIRKFWDNQVTLLIEWKAISFFKTQVGYKNDDKGIILGDTD